MKESLYTGSVNSIEILKKKIQLKINDKIVSVKK